MIDASNISARLQLFTATPRYATSSTDTGHVGGNARFALGHPEKIVARQAPKQSIAKYQRMNKELLP
jgi:hypothetical protein